MGRTCVQLEYKYVLTCTFDNGEPQMYPGTLMNEKARKCSFNSQTNGSREQKKTRVEETKKREKNEIGMIAIILVICLGGADDLEREEPLWVVMIIHPPARSCFHYAACASCAFPCT